MEIKEDQMKLLIFALTALKRVNDIMPISIYLEDESGADGAVDKLTSEKLEPNFLHVITNITAFDATTTVSSNLAVGYVQRGLFHTLQAGKPAATLTVNWIGLAFLNEGAQVQAVFTNTTSGDDIYMVANGFSIPFK